LSKFLRGSILSTAIWIFVWVAIAVYIMRFFLILTKYSLAYFNGLSMYLAIYFGLHLNEKIKLWYDIYRGLGLPADIIIVSKEILEKFKNSKGFIYSYAISEGVVV